MIIDCPRCGFQQPKDDYCANCGIEISTYRKAPPSVAQRLGRNQGSYFFLTIIVVGLLAVLIVNLDSGEPIESLGESQTSVSPTGEIEENSRTRSKASQVTAPNPVAARPQPTAPAPKAKSKALAVKQEKSSALDTKVNQQAALQKIQNSENSEEKPAQTNALLTSPEVKLKFFEVPKSSLNLLSRTEPLVENANFRIQIFEGSTDKLLGAASSIPGNRSAQGKVGQGLKYTAPVLATNPADLIQFEMEVLPLRLGKIASEVQVGFLFEEPGETPISYEQSFVVPEGAKILILGILPHSFRQPEKLKGHERGALVVLDSSDFLTNLTEFLAVIEISQPES